MSIATPNAPSVPAAEPSTKFLRELFVAGDTMLIRPIETWDQDGRKHSKVDYKGTAYPVLGLKAADERVAGVVRAQITRSVETRCNIFFGVCPRFGGGGKYDLAWQVRTVRVIWADIDNATVDDVRARIEKASLPRPSITVNSGNGFHVYWLLDEPYLIDDAEDPPAVEMEWVEKDGKRSPRKYYLDATGERVYLDSPRMAPALSTKAQHAQDVLQGLAAAIGADHTFDLSRILRIPGTLNRKDERNGRAPVPCKLVDLHPGLRYGFDRFEPFALRSPDKARREKVSQVALPVLKKLSPGRIDKLNELVAICSATEVGQRSGVDFRLCCHAIENGIDPEEVWSRVQNVGKFSERGRSYFDDTWDSAASKTQERIYENARAKATKATPSVNGNHTTNSDHWAADDDSIDKTHCPVGLQTAEDVGLTKLLADLITEADHFARDPGGKLCRYHGGAYRAQGERFILAQVKQLANVHRHTTLWSPRLGEAVCEYIRVDCPELWERPPLDFVNVHNGLLRIADRVLLPHSRAARAGDLRATRGASQAAGKVAPARRAGPGLLFVQSDFRQLRIPTGHQPRGPTCDSQRSSSC